jgi:TonB family protein
VQVRKWLVFSFISLVAASGMSVGRASAEEGVHRKVTNQVQPAYPPLARKMNLGGVVKLLVVVGPDGKVKSVKPMGGHPLLINAAEDAIRKWRYEPASQESAGVIEFRFKPE